MRSIILTIAIISCLSSAAWASPIANITVQEVGDHYYWFTYSDVNGKPVVTTPRGFKDKKTSIDLPLIKDAVPKSTLFVLDAKTGNEAVVPVAGKEQSEYKFEIKPAAFDRVRKVNVGIVSASKHKPVAAAIVKLEGADKNVQTQVIDPSSAGVAQFTDVPSGTVKVTVQYGDGKTTTQDVDVPLKREQIAPMIEVPVVGDVETVEPAATAESSDGEESPGKKAVETPSAMNYASALVGLILFAGIVIAAVVLLKNRGATVREALKRAGIDLPDDSPLTAAPQQPAPIQVDPSVCPFCGGKKDPATGTCACSVGSASAEVSGSGPRLIAMQGVYAGSIYSLGSGATTIGREESNDIAFPQDTTASRRHARIEASNGEFKIHDEGSSNGTFVNGVKITEQVLHPGDEIQVGNTRLRFEG